MARFDKGVEQSILACFIADPKLLDKYTKIHKRWFYDDLHQSVFDALKSMRHENKDIDVTTLKSILDAYLIDSIVSSDYVVGHVDSYYKLLEDQYLSRVTVKLLDSAANELRADGSEVSSKDAIDSVLSKLFDISSHHISGDTLVSLRDAGIKAMEDIRNIRENGAVPFKADSDMKSFNKIVPGFSGGDMITIAAGTGVGKTSLALQLALHNARQGKKVGFVSLEMSSKSLYIRLVSFITGISYMRIQSGEITNYEWDLCVRTWQELSKLSLYIEATGSINDMQLKATARRMKDLYEIDVLFVDYIQLINYHDRAGSREIEVSKVSKAIKSIAMELDIPVFNLAQLNRTATGEVGKIKRPVLASLRESGAIEQDSDVVIFLYDAADNGVQAWEDGMLTEGTMEIIVAKYRNSATGIVRVAHISQQMKLADLDFGSVKRLPVDDIKKKESKSLF